MEISAQVVKELRELTGAGMMECKKALQENNGDVKKSVEYLREKGLATAAKKAGRIAAEGLVNAYVNSSNSVGVLLELNCETDFVAKTDGFLSLLNGITESIANSKEKIDDNNISQLPYAAEPGKTINQVMTEKIAQIGENMNLRRFARYEATQTDYLESYIHMGGRIGVLLQVSLADAGKKSNPAFKTLVKDLTLQIAASKPEYVGRSEVPAEVVEKEKEIYKKMAMNEGKPEQVAEKITIGRLEKFYKEICLLEQPFVKDQNITIAKLLADKANELGAISLVRFARFEKGEGLEKRKDDFAQEVMAELKK